MGNKKSEMDFGGDIGTALFDLAEIILIKIWELVAFIFMYLINRYIFKLKKSSLKKIERRDLNCKKETRKEASLGYSITQKKDILLNDLDKRCHTLICGASGFGKTVLLDTLIYDDMKKKKPVIFIDPKGDRNSLQQFIDLCRVSGRDFRIFSEYYDGYGSISLNPVKDGSFTHIADRIHHCFNWSEEHYETLCYRALKKATAELLRDREGVSFKALFDSLVNLSNPQNPKKEFERKNIEGIIARLENIIESDFGSKLCESGLSLKDVWESGKCIYIGIPVLGYPQIARSLGKIILGDLAYAVYNAYRKVDVKKPVGVYIDELSAIITDEFIELLNKCRGAGMELNFAFQSPSDIKKVSPYLCEQILENSSNWFIFKQRVETGACTFAEAIGTIQGTKETVRFENGETKEIGSQRQVEELLAHHNIIKNLRQGQAILLRHSPVRLDLINIKYIDPEIVKNNIQVCEAEKWIKPLSTVQQKQEQLKGNYFTGENEDSL